MTLHVRLSEATEGLLGAEEFEQMRSRAFLVNTARGGLVDEDALVDALDAGELAGAALDVFREEPLPEDHALVGRDDVVLTPHVAGSTRDAVLGGPRIVAEDLARWLDGGAVPAALEYGAATAALKRTLNGDLALVSPAEVEATIEGEDGISR